MTVQCQSSRVRPLWPGAGFTPEAPRSQGRSLVRAKALVSVGPATPGGTEPPPLLLCPCALVWGDQPPAGPPAETSKPF